MYKQLLYLTAFVLFFSATAAAQTSGLVTGKVTDTLDRPLPGANVVIRKLDLRTSADATGAFRLAGVPAGRYTVRISSTGYRPVELSVQVHAAGEASLAVRLQDLAADLSDVVVSASRRAESLSQTPSSVTVVSEKDIRTQSAISPNLANILAFSVPGLGTSTNQTGNSGQTLRGRNVLVLIDGIPQSTPLRAGGRDIRSIDPAVIGRIEVIKGATAIYGNGAEGGLINYLTKRGDTSRKLGGYSQLGLTGNTRGDSTVGYRAVQQLFGKAGRIDYMVSGAFEKTGVYRDAEGLVISPDYGLGETRSYNGFTKIGYTLSAKQRLELMYNYFSSRQQSDYVLKNGVYGQRPAIGIRGTRGGAEEGTRYNHNANLQYTNQRIFGKTDLAANVYFQDFYTIYSQVASFYGGGQSAIKSAKKGARASLNTPLVFSDAVSAQLNYGIDLMNDRTSQSLVDGRLWVPDMNMVNFAPYLQTSTNLFSDLTIKAGLRAENINIAVDDFNTLATGPNGQGSIAVRGGTLNYNAFVFNAGARYSASRYFNPFVSYAQSFSVFELGRVLRAAKANTLEQLETKPIIVNNYEGGFSSQVGPLNFSAAYYYSTSRLGANLLEVNGVYISQRIPEHVWGYELQADIEVLKGVNIGGNYAQVEGKGDVDNDGNFDGEKDVYLNTTRIPPSKATAYLSVSAVSDLSLQLNWTRIGNRDRFAPNAAGKYLIGEGPVRAYHLFNFSAGYRAGKAISLNLGVENLFNHVYYPAISQFYGSDGIYARGNGRRFNLSVGFTY
ncbi:ferric aerobactin receptor [Pedobacter yulinensis]|uniref:Ferric aerobactin receptor n=1 Tax=Pedobacter yulinensis TaxID=2126353 RepID=A0A2T3HI20_9SPHI|nr:TonB-dependent receptor [Pedobacter yulinensis]PST82082.1 ferric aerobactin receptor [Pedobacter yulinensis]